MKLLKIPLAHQQPPVVQLALTQPEIRYLHIICKKYMAQSQHGNVRLLASEIVEALDPLKDD